MSIQEHAAEWFLRLHARDLSIHERFAYLEWLKTSPVHIGETLLVCRLYSKLYPMKMQLQPVNEGTSSNVIELPQRESGAAPARRRSWSVRLAAAVAVVAIGLLVLFAQQAWIGGGIETQAGEWRNLTLADGSFVSVGPRTRLRDRFSDERRLVRLSEGEVLFRVAKDVSRPFIVDAQIAVVRATGTSFGVSRHADGVTVTVSEGSVTVTSPLHGSASASLGAGDQVTVSDTVPPAVKRVSAERELAWASRRLVFRNHSVMDAVEEFNRRNRTQIVVAPELRDAQVHGVFRADDPLSFVKIVAAKHGVVVREAQDVVRLEARGRDPGQH